jgi:hypothetical protein
MIFMKCFIVGLGARKNYSHQFMDAIQVLKNLIFLDLGNFVAEEKILEVALLGFYMEQGVDTHNRIQKMNALWRYTLHV